MGRSARGVTGIRFEGDDNVVSMTVVQNGKSDITTPEGETEELTLLTVCQNGYGKRTKVSEYRSQNRGGKGLIDIQTEGRNGPVIEAMAVTSAVGIMLITSGGKIIRTSTRDVSVIGRNTRGVKMIDLDTEEKVVAVAPASNETNGSDDSGSTEGGSTEGGSEGGTPQETPPTTEGQTS